ncbi:MAG: SCO family protein [Aquincola tertiaricarbonis]|uniref:SCO family protein n=1 Tax=Aquincola TaxID=391952 RepID=UPI00061531DA|nr:MULTISPECIES: SCO family protein [Aquincola]MCR5866925.1 SCO family protein [Aquincola sp. J276]
MAFHLTFSRRACLAGAAAAALLLAGCDKFSSTPKAAFTGVDITGADYAQKLSLKDPDGKQRSLDEFKGKVVVVFFGFTQCPDVCPTTMAELAEVKRSLGPDGDKVQGIFVSVDPERDTPELLKAYVANFDPGFVALRGTPEETKAAAREFKVFYTKVPGKTEGAYSVDHTAGSYLFDPQGKVRLFTRYGSGAQALASDIKALLAGA